MSILGDVVLDADLGAATFQYKRVSGEFDNEGEYTREFSDEVDFVANIQPIAEERVVRYLPEGDRYDAYIACFTATSLIEDDVIIADGLEFKVFKIADWGRHGFYRVLAGRKNDV